MATSKKSVRVGRHRRAEELPVHRWLKLGAASAGMGAALIGWSLVGSEAGVASADSGVESSSSAGPAASNSPGADSGSTAPSRSGGAGTVASGDNDSRAHGPATTSRTATRSPASDTDAPARVTSRSNRAAAAETRFAADKRTETTVADRRTASRTAAPDSRSADAPSASAASAVKPSAATTSEVAQGQQTPGSPVPGGGAGTPVGVTAGVRDGLGAIAKLVAQATKDALSSRPLQNSLQGLGPKIPGLLDLIPKVRYQVEDPLRRAVQRAQEAEAKRDEEIKDRRINEIVQKGVRLIASNGRSVFTADGVNFVKYEVAWTSVFGDKVTEGPLRARLVALREGPHLDRNIRSILRVDPAQVRSLLGRR